MWGKKPDRREENQHKNEQKYDTPNLKPIKCLNIRGGIRRTQVHFLLSPVNPETEENSAPAISTSQPLVNPSFAARSSNIACRLLSTVKNEERQHGLSGISNFLPKVRVSAVLSTIDQHGGVLYMPVKSAMGLGEV